MTNAAAVSILALTVGLSLRRPSIGRFQIHPPLAAVIGATLMILGGFVSGQTALDALELLLFPVITIVSLMVITLVAEQAGFFRVLAYRISIAGRGDGRRLFTYLFFAGAVTGALFTNDAAVLIFTPLVYELIERVQAPTWTRANKLPYYFAVLYIANLVAPFVISNPINILVATIFEIGFLEYTKWMLLPALASVVVSYLGLRIFFGKAIPLQYVLPTSAVTSHASSRFLYVSGIVLSLTLIGLFTGQLTSLPVWLVTTAGAIALMVLYRMSTGDSVTPVIRGVGWDVIVFVVGIFIVANGLREVGLTGHVGELILMGSSDFNVPLASTITAFVAAIYSAVMNNHPTAGLMALAIEDLSLSTADSKLLAFAALIGGDLGPKMLPIGSLAALLWFRMLRSRGVDISYGLYVKIGLPVSLTAIALAVLALNVELWIARTFA